jgi:hypothetical protein
MSIGTSQGIGLGLDENVRLMMHGGGGRAVHSTRPDRPRGGGDAAGLAALAAVASLLRGGHHIPGGTDDSPQPDTEPPIADALPVTTDLS